MAGLLAAVAATALACAADESTPADVMQTGGGAANSSSAGGVPQASTSNAGGTKLSSGSGGTTNAVGFGGNSTTTTATAQAFGGGSGCTPSDMSGFAYPGYVPARHLPGSCTEQVIKRYYTDCVTNNQCTSFVPGAADAGCGACLYPTELSAKSYGPLLKIGTSTAFFYQTNIDGCEALIGQTGCAPKMQVDLLCQYNACANNCPLVERAGIQSMQQCMSTAMASQCSAEHAAASCLSDSSAAFACWGSDFQAQFVTIAKVFCL